MPSFRDIVFTISSISDVSEALPLSIWLLYSKKQKPYLILGIFFVLCFVLRLITLITAEHKHNNMPEFHLLALLEISAVYIYYCQLIYNKIYPSGLILLFVFHVENTLWFQNCWSFNSITWTVDMLLIIAAGFFYFFKLYQNDIDYRPLKYRADFVITIGWLLYASGSLFTYLMGTEILSGYAEGFFKNGWFFQTVSNILKDIVISYGFWLTRKK